MSGSAGKAGLIFVIVLAVTGVLIVFIAFGPPGLYAKTETPEYCGSCHVIQDRYESWFHSGAHAQIKCVDCHLPNDTFIRHLTWKTLDGLKDWLAFHMGRVSEPIKISARGAGFVRENCLRCHGEIMSRVNEERRCWECHRKLTHQGTGVILTWTQQ